MYQLEDYLAIYTLGKNVELYQYSLKHQLRRIRNEPIINMCGR